MSATAHTAGENAAKDGKTAADCPYPIGILRRAWLDGFFSERPEILRKGNRPKSKKP
ncbi:MAG: Rmf/CrpP family protein [Pirellulaceae bacterium]